MNGKAYVGQTKHHILKRFKEHCQARSVLGSAIRKYGPENFEIEHIASSFDIQSLNEAEMSLINSFGTAVPHGYNVIKPEYYIRPIVAPSNDPDFERPPPPPAPPQTYYKLDIEFIERLDFFWADNKKLNIDLQESFRQACSRLTESEITKLEKTLLPRFVKKFKIKTPIQKCKVA